MVHFAEELHQAGYEAALLRSFARRPTPHSAWMLNRLRNGAQNAADRGAAFRKAAADPATDPEARPEIARYLDKGA